MLASDRPVPTDVCGTCGLVYTADHLRCPRCGDDQRIDITKPCVVCTRETTRRVYRWLADGPIRCDACEWLGYRPL